MAKIDFRPASDLQTNPRRPRSTVRRSTSRRRPSWQARYSVYKYADGDWHVLDRDGHMVADGLMDRKEAVDTAQALYRATAKRNPRRAVKSSAGAPRRTRRKNRWTPKDAYRHTHRANTEERRRQWAHVANSAWKRGYTEARAIEQANGVLRDHPTAKRNPRKRREGFVVEMYWPNNGKPFFTYMKMPQSGKVLQASLVRVQSKATVFGSEFRAREAARQFRPYADKRMEWMRVVKV